ncbi:MAG: erythromycin esterase family protein [Gammaproteobacteria bacterium]
MARWHLSLLAAAVAAVQAVAGATLPAVAATQIAAAVNQVDAAATRAATAATQPAVPATGASAADFVACAARYASPQAGVEPNSVSVEARRESQADDLAALLTLAAHAQVFALGEPGHGGHEPLALRNRAFQHLIEHGGFTAVALETSFTESRELHDFVLGRAVEGDARTLVRRDFSWGFGEYAENVQLIQWLHDYNADASHIRKIRFYGIDLSGADNQDGFSKARSAVDHALRVLERDQPSRAERFRAELAPLLARFSDRDYSTLSAPEGKRLERALASIATSLQRGDGEDFEWARREILIAQRLQALFRVAKPRPDAETMLPSDYRMVNVRDAAMAANVQWVLRQEGANARLLLFAHNAHVMNERTRGGIWNVFDRPPQMMGQHLRRALGARLLTVGTLVRASGPGLPSAPPPADSVEEALAGLNLPLFLLDLRKAACSPGASDWLSRRHAVRANFNTELDVVPGKAFDAIEFIAEATPAWRN